MLKVASASRNFFTIFNLRSDFSLIYFLSKVVCFSVFFFFNSKCWVVCEAMLQFSLCLYPITLLGLTYALGVSSKNRKDMKKHLKGF